MLETSKMKSYKVALLPGDGIGPEVVNAAVKVLTAVEEQIGTYQIDWQQGEAGLNVVEKYGTNLPLHTVEMLKTTVAALKGPMTTPSGPTGPRSATIQIRKMFELYANVRPCFTLPGVPSLKPNIDLVIVRENTEGLYAGIEFEVGEAAVAMRVISRKGSERIARYALQLAMQRKRHLTYVHKANVLKLTDGVFSQAVRDVATKEFPEITVDDRIVDAMSMALIRMPETFDVVVTTNLFGDILSDEAAQLVGGLGTMSGANIGDKWALFEPVHGSAPDIAGQGIGNPIATIFAGKRLLDYLGEDEAASVVEKAVFDFLKAGESFTPDLGGTAKTQEMADAIVAKI